MLPLSFEWVSPFRWATIWHWILEPLLGQWKTLSLLRTCALSLWRAYNREWILCAQKLLPETLGFLVKTIPSSPSKMGSQIALKLPNSLFSWDLFLIHQLPTFQLKSSQALALLGSVDKSFRIPRTKAHCDYEKHLYPFLLTSNICAGISRIRQFGDI